MPKTAYSKKFERELDPEQLLALFKYDMSSDPDLKNLPKELRDEIYRDLVCPECGVSGCVIVSRAKSKKTSVALRQPHFRFVAVEGASAHHPLCDHYDDFNLKTNEKEQLVDFGQDRATETKVIRELVARGIENGVFTQKTIRDMRQWFFDTKTSHRFTMNLSEAAIRWADKLRRLYSCRGIPFTPIHAELPKFDWEHAAKLQFCSENDHLFAIIRNKRYYYHKSALQGTLKIVKKFQGQSVFDVTVLESYYTKSIELACFIARNLPLYERSVDLKLQEVSFGIAPAVLMAFAALLLYVSDWDINDAISKLVIIVGAPQPIDINAGNIIGLNPFHDFTAWANIMQIKEIAESSNDGFDYDSQLKIIEQHLRDQYATWKRLQSFDLATG